MPKPTNTDQRGYMFSDDIQFMQKAIIISDEQPNKILAIQRHLEEYSRPGDRDLPGGSVLYGESSEDSLRREVKEEVGISVGEFEAVHFESYYIEDKGLYRFGYVATCKTSESTITLSDEHIDRKWLNKEEFYDLCKLGWFRDIVYQWMD